jgi:hypothetical protein
VPNYFFAGDGTRLERARALQQASTDPDERFLLDGTKTGFAPHISQTAQAANVNSVLSGDVALAGRSWRAYFKPTAGVSTSTASAYGHMSRIDVGLHEIVAWRLARALGEPWKSMVPPAVWWVPPGLPDPPDAATIEGTGPLVLGLPGAAGLAPPGRGFDQLISDAAFFDALIGAQDRHHENLRSDPAPPPLLGLIDHGYAFARPGDLHNAYDTAGFFIKLRRGVRSFRRLGFSPVHYSGVGQLSMTLANHERAALAALKADLRNLLGVAPLLEADRAEAMRERIRRMDASGEILREGDF